MKKIIINCVATALALGTATQASAAINLPVPANAFITFNNQQWAWASPCAPASVGGSCDQSNLFAFQGSLGWRLPTAAELAAGPSASNFLFAGANVPNGGVDPISGANFQFGSTNSDGACATPYFSSSYNHCDIGNGQAGLVYPATDSGFAETWAVRDVTGAVPEPGTWAMMLAGFGMIGFTVRRRSSVKTAVSFA